MRTQRKIPHLLANNGLSGRDFQYLPTLNPEVVFDWNLPVILTDKIDGTTVQADNTGIYKRIDLFKSGDPRKHSASEEERYGLRKLDENAPENKWILDACSKYRDIFNHLPDDHTVYFEAFGDKIQSRYAGVDRDIRVFDMAWKDQFTLFRRTVDYCESLGLPTVGWDFKLLAEGVSTLLKILPEARHIEEYFDLVKPVELEGVVLRQLDRIAKIRKADLAKVKKD